MESIKAILAQEAKEKANEEEENLEKRKISWDGFVVVNIGLVFAFIAASAGLNLLIIWTFRRVLGWGYQYSWIPSPEYDL